MALDLVDLFDRSPGDDPDDYSGGRKHWKRGPAGVVFGYSAAELPNITRRDLDTRFILLRPLHEHCGGDLRVLRKAYITLCELVDDEDFNADDVDGGEW